MSEQIRVTAGERVYFPITVSAGVGPSITADTFRVGFGGYYTPPAVWDPPDFVEIIDNTDIRLYRWLGNQAGDRNPGVGSAWPWVQVNDVGGEVRLIRVSQLLNIT